MKLEVRGGIPVELRAEEDGNIRVEGHAAVFNEEADIGGMFRERFAPGAFTNTIRSDDVVFLINHDGLPLARTRSGTLRLKEDRRGLKVSSALDLDDPDVQQIRTKMARGDLDKMSIAFTASRQEWDEDGDIPLRTIMEARLFDVSIVNTPAYDGTDIALRSREEARSERKAHNFHAARRRLAMKMNLDLRKRQGRENGKQPIPAQPGKPVKEDSHE